MLILCYAFKIQKFMLMFSSQFTCVVSKVNIPLKNQFHDCCFKLLNQGVTSKSNNQLLFYQLIIVQVVTVKTKQKKHKCLKVLQTFFFLFFTNIKWGSVL